MNSMIIIYVPATGTGYTSDNGWPSVKYWYDITVEVEGSGEASASQTAIVKQGKDEVTLTATPQEGWHFKEWQAPDGITITDNKFIIPDDYAAKENITIKAVFEEHTWSADWTQGDTTHWHDCTFDTCDATSEKIAHTPTYTASGATITATCGDCGKALGDATISAASGIYNGLPHTAEVSGTDTMENMTWSIAYKEQGGTALSAAPADAGSYTASITIGGATASVDFSISPKTVNNPTITLAQDSYEYTGSAIQPTVIVKDGDNVIPASEYTVEYSSNTNLCIDGTPCAVKVACTV